MERHLFRYLYKPQRDFNSINEPNGIAVDLECVLFLLFDVHLFLIRSYRCRLCLSGVWSNCVNGCFLFTQP